MAVTVPACSVPPVTTASAMSQAIRRAAYVSACVPAAQAVQIVSVGPAEAVPHRDRRAGRVGHHHRHEERRDTPLALVHPDVLLLLERVDAADAGAEDRADPRRIGGQLTRLLDRLDRGRDRVLLDEVGPAGLLR